MSDENKKILESIGKALDQCSDSKKSYFLGFAEGIETMIKKEGENAQDDKATDQA